MSQPPRRTPRPTRRPRSSVPLTEWRVRRKKGIIAPRQSIKPLDVAREALTRRSSVRERWICVSGLPLLLRFREKFAGPKPERFGNAFDVVQADVLFAALDGTHVRPMYADRISETLL